MTHDKEKENFGEKRNQDESNFIEWESKKKFQHGPIAAAGTARSRGSWC